MKNLTFINGLRNTRGVPGPRALTFRTAIGTAWYTQQTLNKSVTCVATKQCPEGSALALCGTRVGVSLWVQRGYVQGSSLEHLYPLTQLCDAAHTGGQERLLNGPQLRLAEHGQLPGLAGPLRVSVQVQAVWQAQHSCSQKGEKERGTGLAVSSTRGGCKISKKPVRLQSHCGDPAVLDPSRYHVQLS
jgi:hypothetical protein